ncbi:glycosyltransferase [Xinfangfangia pollutisoli]|uniref:glycosyltransferase n=1 Tax=Xinfangfangia pollutisoli TaxID=2865960 RepID=UPI001CD7792E|nr:glycosyltransferase [Xinfangfangia pollutisoli]
MKQEFFDADHYCRQCGHVLSKNEAWQHFQNDGDALGLDPSPYFSTRFYKDRYRDWGTNGATALDDYLVRTANGHKRQPHPLIDADDYLGTYPDLLGFGQSAVLHFILHGDAEGRSPSKGFDAGFYRRCYLALGQSHPFRHYVTEGSARGFLPRPTPVDAAMSGAAMAAAMTGRPRPFVLVCHDAQKAGVPILTLDLARALGARGYDPVFLLGNAGPLLDRFRAIGPVFILAEGWDATGLASALPQRTAALINTSAAAGLAVPLAQAGLDCLVLLHEMPDYIRDQGLMPDLRLAQEAGARLIASIPQISRGISPLISPGTSRGKAGPPGGAPCPVGQLRPGIIPPPTSLASFRRARLWRQRQDGPVFIGAGHADKRKGFDLFLDAARRIRAAQPGARFVWLGALDSWARDLANAALAEGLPLALPGFVEDCLGWYRAADVYLLTSRQDPGPTTAIHAAAVGTPFVGYAADIGLIGMTEGVGRFLPPEDEAGFVAAAVAAASAVTSGSRRDLRRLIRRETGFGPYVTALLSRFHLAADREA